ncbi:MAG TPA: NDP-sugar synthase [Dehalococcoidia bacterium]|nr:NDP-sugar synthase [Dehalococcoidia bacterium]
MNAVILVGGSGTRLRPLTYAVPKPLIPVLNRPLITHLIDNLKRHGVRHIVLAATASDRRIEETLGDGTDLGVELSYSYEPEPLGSGLAVKLAARDFDGPFFVCNGDVLSDLDLTDMARCHVERGAAMTIFLARVSDPSSYGIADLQDDGRITRFVEKPARGEAPSNFGNAGTWLFDPLVLDLIPDEKMDGSIERLLTPGLIANGRLVLGYPSDAYWMDLGTSERYLQIHADILNGLIPSWLPKGVADAPSFGEGCEVWPDASVSARVIMGRGCRIGGLTRIQGPSVLGNDCVVRDNAFVEGCVIWDGARIGSGALVRDSIIGAGCLVGDDAIVEGAVLASGARVKRGAKLGPGTKLEPDEVAG